MTVIGTKRKTVGYIGEVCGYEDMQICKGTHSLYCGCHLIVDKPLIASPTEVYTGDLVMLSNLFTSRTVACKWFAKHRRRGTGVGPTITSSENGWADFHVELASRIFSHAYSATKRGANKTCAHAECYILQHLLEKCRRSPIACTTMSARAP